MFNTSKCDKTAGVAGQQSAQLVTGQSRQQPIVVGPSAANQQRGPTLVSSGAGARTSNTISQVHQCPTFDVGHQQDIVIADGSERELSIRVKNMPQFKVSTRVEMCERRAELIRAGNSFAKCAQVVAGRRARRRRRRRDGSIIKSGPVAGRRTRGALRGRRHASGSRQLTRQTRIGRARVTQRRVASGAARAQRDREGQWASECARVSAAPNERGPRSFIHQSRHEN